MCFNILFNLFRNKSKDTKMVSIQEFNKNILDVIKTLESLRNTTDNDLRSISQLIDDMAGNTIRTTFWLHKETILQSWVGESRRDLLEHMIIEFKALVK